jgi:hypothetical protein
MRFLMYAILLFLVYQYFIKPIFNGFRDQDNRNYKKVADNDNISGHQVNGKVADDQGEYIEYEEIDDDKNIKP